MLFGKNRRRYQICYLPVILYCLKCCPDGNLCLSESNIPTDKSIHNLATFHVMFGIVNGFLLIQCLLIWEHLFKLPLPYGILGIFVSLCARTDRIQLDQFLRNILHMSFDTRAHFLPLRAAKLVQLDTCAILAGQLTDTVELFHRHEQFAALCILDTDIVLHASIGFHLVDTAVDSDTVILMYDIIANGNIRESGDLLTSIFRQFLPFFQFLRGKYIALCDHKQMALRDLKPRLHSSDTDAHLARFERLFPVLGKVRHDIVIL